jgi:LEA14-like dessication related protein
MMIRFRQILGGLLVVTLCYAVTPAQEKPAPDKPQVVLKDIHFDKLDLWKKTVEMIAVVEIKNQGAALKLRDMNYKLKLNDHPVAEGKYADEIALSATDKTEVQLPFTLDLTSLPGVTWDMLTESFTLRYEIETEFTLPLFAALKHTQKTSFKGDLPIGEAVYSLSKKFKEKIFGNL